MMSRESCFANEEKERNLLRLPKDILVVRNGALGDFILTLPVIKSLKKAFPLARIVVTGNATVLELAQNQVAGIIPNDMPRLYTLYQDHDAIPEDIEQKLSCFDLVVVYGSDPEGILIHNLRKIGIPWIIDGTFSLGGNLTTSVIDLLLSSLKREGIPVHSETPHVTPSSKSREFAGKFLESLRNGERSRALVAFHPGSGSPKKCWPVKNFGHLALWIKNVFNATILLISGPADQYVTEAIMPLIEPSGPVLIRQFSLPHVAAILERCTLYIGNDSGITHLAAAVGTSALALFGPTDFRVWGPKNENVTYLQSPYPCAPCSPHQMAQCSNPACMAALSLAAVEKAIYETFSHLLLSFSSSDITYRFGRNSYHV